MKLAFLHDNPIELDQFVPLITVVFDAAREFCVEARSGAAGLMQINLQ